MSKAPFLKYIFSATEEPLNLKKFCEAAVKQKDFNSATRTPVNIRVESITENGCTMHQLFVKIDGHDEIHASIAYVNANGVPVRDSQRDEAFPRFYAQEIRHYDLSYVSEDTSLQQMHKFVGLFLADYYGENNEPLINYIKTHKTYFLTQPFKNIMELWLKIAKKQTKDEQKEFLSTFFNVNTPVTCRLTNILVPRPATSTVTIECQTGLIANLDEVRSSVKQEVRAGWNRLGSVYIIISPAYPQSQLAIGYHRIPKEDEKKIRLQRFNRGEDTNSIILPEELKPILEKLYESIGLQFHECAECHHYVTHLFDTICFHCVEAQFPGIQILSYSDDVTKHIKVIIPKPENVPFPRLKELTLIGCELEYNCTTTNSFAARKEILTHLKNHVIFKRDGSLQEGGFEVVTIPAEPQVHLSKFKPLFESFPSYLSTGEQVGMHIHLTRKVLTPLLLARLHDFVHNPQNKAFLELIGERAMNSYCAQASTGWRAGLFPSGGVRGALNLNKEPTVEFRFFRSPEKWVSFAKNIQFVTALLDFQKAGWTNLTPKESRSDGKFLDYIIQHNRSRNPERNPQHDLALFLKEKGVIK